MSIHDDLIGELSNNLEPARPASSVNLLAGAWLLLSAIYVVGVIHFFGPIRPNAYTQLATVPRFLIESVLGLVAIGVTTYAAFRAAVPGALNKLLANSSIALMGLWLASYLVGLYNPALEPSMLGKRGHCFSETFIYALPPMLIAFVLVRRLYPLQPLTTATIIGLSAGMLPALYMQIACMYDPGHIILFHILPGFMVAAIGLTVAALWLTFRSYNSERQI